MKRIGTVVFIIGVIIASLYAAPTPPKWAPFILGLIITVAGGLMARQRPAAGKNGDEGETGEYTPELLIKRLESLGDMLDRLSGSSEKNIADDPNKLQADIETAMLELNHMIEGRYDIQNILGMQAFSDIYSQLAQVERNLNRAWSTLVDGYPKDTLESLKDAQAMIPRTREMVKQLT